MHYTKSTDTDIVIKTHNIDISAVVDDGLEEIQQPLQSLILVTRLLSELEIYVRNRMLKEYPCIKMSFATRELDNNHIDGELLKLARLNHSNVSASSMIEWRVNINDYPSIFYINYGYRTIIPPFTRKLTVSCNGKCFKAEQIASIKDLVNIPAK